MLVHLIGKLPNRATKALNRRVVSMIEAAPLPCHTITSDYGTEFHGYAGIETATGTTVCFARPHHPWQRGTNKNTYELIRQYLPKGKIYGEPGPEAVRCDRTQAELQAGEAV